MSDLWCSVRVPEFFLRQPQVIEYIEARQNTAVRLWDFHVKICVLGSRYILSCILWAASWSCKSLFKKFNYPLTQGALLLVRSEINKVYCNKFLQRASSFCPGIPLRKLRPPGPSSKRLRMSCTANDGIYVIHRALPRPRLSFSGWSLTCDGD